MDEMDVIRGSESQFVVSPHHQPLTLSVSELDVLKMASITNSKCVLVLGATSGLGRALARSIQALPSKPTVIITGRRKERLDELAKENFETIQFDNDTTKDKLKEFVDSVLHKYPDVSVVYRVCYCCTDSYTISA
jgi:NADPH:quinone reductase-like Zn-dependent oxidoreductase